MASRRVVPYTKPTGDCVRYPDLRALSRNRKLSFVKTVMQCEYLCFVTGQLRRLLVVASVNPRGGRAAERGKLVEVESRQLGGLYE